MKMTLIKILSHCDLSDEIQCPKVLLPLDVVYDSPIDVMELTQYLKSEKFKHDSMSLLLDYDETVYNGLSPYLVLNRDKDTINLTLKAECL